MYTNGMHQMKQYSNRIFKNVYRQHTWEEATLKRPTTPPFGTSTLTIKQGPQTQITGSNINMKQHFKSY